MLLSCVESSFSVPTSSSFPFLSLTCPPPASLHLFLIPSLVYLYIVIVPPHVPFCQLALSSPVMPACVLHQCLLLCPPVGMFVFFVPWDFIDFYLAFVCTLFKLFSRYGLALCVYISFCLTKLALSFLILPPMRCLHLGCHLACQFITETSFVTLLLSWLRRWPRWVVLCLFLLFEIHSLLGNKLWISNTLYSSIA